VGGAVSAETPTKEFDLTALATTTDKNARPRTILLWGLAAFGGVLVGMGLYLLDRGLGTGQIGTDAGGILVVILGVTTIFLSGSSLRGSGASARRMCVSDQGILLGAIPGKSDIAVRWSDPKLKVQIVDATAWPRGQKGAGGQRPSDYLIRFSNSPYTPIPAEAFHAVMSEARNQTVRVDHKQVQDRDGPTVVWTLSS
jgi:hypothetical protein